jgi:LuxR family maltose regulon positive regulatory protein
MADGDSQQALCEALRLRPDLQFVLAGRSQMPGWLMPFELSGRLRRLGTCDLMLDRQTTLELLRARGVRPSPEEMLAMERDLNGYPLALALAARHLASGHAYDASVLDATKQDLFVYFDEAVYRRVAPPTRRLLLGLAPFERFDIDMARTISGDRRSGEIVGRLQRDSSMMVSDGLDSYRFWPIFREFLQWEARRELSDDERREVFGRAGIHYELEDDIAEALECYSRAGDYHKVREMIERNSELHPGTGHYFEMERFYRSLPPDEIRRSPALMSGMSMLCAMSLDFDASEEWYEELRAYASGLSKTDADYRDVIGKIAYLDIALPQRGVSDLVDLLRSVARLVVGGQARIPAFSVTSMMPSIMNGGKDFCEWSKRDDLLYATMRVPVEAVLGRDGVGLAECSICESKYEKGEDVSSRLLTLMSRIGDIQANGTRDIEFALVGLVARVQVSQGKAPAALDALANLRERYEGLGEARFFPNIDAMSCRIRLRLGDVDEARRWLEQDAPGDGLRLWVFWRYRYITKALALIAVDSCDEALLVLAQLRPYCERCARVLDGIALGLLTAVCDYRLGRPEWREELDVALDTCREYSFVTPVAQLGAAVMPLLRETRWEGDPAFLKRVVTAARAQAIRYPSFLDSPARLLDPLSPTELQVLHLLVGSMSNKRIAEALDVKLSTVKTHVSHIFQKLGVSSRAQAKDAAERLHLV